MMSVLKFLISLFIWILMIRLFMGLMAFVGKLLHVSDGIIFLSEGLKNVYLRLVVCSVSAVVLLLVYRNSIDGIYGVISLLILIITFVDFGKINRSGVGHSDKNN